VSRNSSNRNQMADNFETVRQFCKRISGRACLAGFCVGVAAGFLPAGVHADTGPWTTPVNVSTPLTGGWFPDVAADDAGNVHVVWNGNYPSAAAAQVGSAPSALAPIHADELATLYYTRLSGGRWTAPSDIAVIWIGHALRAALFAEPSGLLHMTYKGLGTPAQLRNEEDLWHTVADGLSAGSPHAWRAPRRLTEGQIGYFSDVVVDAQKVVHSIWTEADAQGYGLYYSKSSDGGQTWSKRTALEGSELVWWYRAHLKVDSENRLHVVWETTDGWGTTRGAAYARSVDQGATWTIVRFSPTYQTSDPLGNGGPGLYGPQQPVVGIDGSGNVLIVFREPDSNRIVYRRSTDGRTWSPPVPMPGVTGGPSRPYDIYDMQTDSAGHIHVVMVGSLSGSADMALLHSEWDGAQWSNPLIIAGSPPFPEYPKLAIGSGNRLHVVWFGGNRSTIDRDAVGIWYSSATTSAPAKASQFETHLQANSSPAPSSGTAADRVLPAGSADADEIYRGIQAAQPDETGETTNYFAWLTRLSRRAEFPIFGSLLPPMLFVGAVMLKNRRTSARRTGGHIERD
jgi:hypothetical protein